MRQPEIFDNSFMILLSIRFAIWPNDIANVSVIPCDLNSSSVPVGFPIVNFMRRESILHSFSKFESGSSKSLSLRAGPPSPVSAQYSISIVFDMLKDIIINLRTHINYKGDFKSKIWLIVNTNRISIIFLFLLENNLIEIRIQSNLISKWCFELTLYFFDTTILFNTNNCYGYYTVV